MISDSAQEFNAQMESWMSNLHVVIQNGINAAVDRVIEVQAPKFQAWDAVFERARCKW